MLVFRKILRKMFSMKCNTELKWVHPLSANPTKWSNTLKQFIGCSCIGCIIRTPFPKNNSIDWFPYEKIKKHRNDHNFPWLCFQKITIKRTETVTLRCWVKKAFLKILNNSHENTCDRVSFYKASFKLY